MLLTQEVQVPSEVHPWHLCYNYNIWTNYNKLHVCCKWMQMQLASATFVYLLVFQGKVVQDFVS